MATTSSRGRWLAVVAGAAVLGVFWLAPPGPPAVAPTVAPVASRPSETDRVAAPATPAGPNVNPPPGLSTDHWNALTAELRGRPDGPAELRRLASYFEWSDVLRHFRDARAAGASAADLLPLAQTLDAGLPERLRLAEFSAAEARQIKSAIFEVTVPDESMRVERLQQWAAATFAPTAPDPRQAEFERRQSEIVAAWSARPTATRDHAELTRELDGLRRQSFSSSTR